MAEINKTMLIKRDKLRVIRLELQAGAAVPEHAANAHVVIVPLKGQGTFTINKTPHPISAGTVLEMEPNVPHAVKAETDLEIMVIQIIYE